ncbi:MAG: hypothetical protein BWY09_02590 [Candidatus Hydrogenedentes bacterium ADurb.Bin179]|nr:MAG: hypothetical protein BWY09_02590 [Candidatus Hydrogenedentes bacterium ADurb.Bin179]
MGFGGGQNEDAMGRGFFQRFEQGVECSLA